MGEGRKRPALQDNPVPRRSVISLVPFLFCVKIASVFGFHQLLPQKRVHKALHFQNGCGWGSIGHLRVLRNNPGACKLQSPRPRLAGLVCGLGTCITAPSGARASPSGRCLCLHCSAAHWWRRCARAATGTQSRRRALLTSAAPTKHANRKGGLAGVVREADTPLASTERFPPRSHLCALFYICVIGQNILKNSSIYCPFINVTVTYDPNPRTFDLHQNQ